MSSRVQKGSQVFRPVAKSRGRQNDVASRHSSTVPDTVRTRTPAPPPSRALSVINETSAQDTSPLTTHGAGANDEIIEKIANLRNSPEQQRRPPVLVSSSTVDSQPKRIQIPSRSQPVAVRPEASTSYPTDTIEHAPNITTDSQDPSTSTSAATLTAGGQQTDDPSAAIPGPSRLATKETGEMVNGTPIVPNTKRRTSRSRSAAPFSGDEGQQASSSRMRRQRKNSRGSTTVNPMEETEDNLHAERDNSSGSEYETARKKRRRSKTTSSPTSRRGRPRKAQAEAVFDNDAEPGQELDPTTVTMADICQDTGQGRVSSKAAIIQKNHLAWKASNREKRERMRAIMEAKKYGRKETELDDVPPVSTQQAEEPPPGDGNTPAPAEVVESVADAEDNGDEFNYRQTLETNRFSVKVRIGPNGETVIDEESLHVDRVDNDESTEHYQQVEESDQTKFTNSSTYTKKLRGQRWSAEETELFFHALSQFGENYELISYVLPGRDRKACKNKFKAEDKKNPARITFSLTHRVPYDIQLLSRLTGKDFTGPTPEIRAPPVATLQESTNDFDVTTEQHTQTSQPAKQIRKKSRTPSAAGEAVEVLGNIDDYDSN